MREVHIQANRARELEGRLPRLRFNPHCDPVAIPAGTLCYQYPRGCERELEQVAHSLGIDFTWGGGPTFRGTAIVEVV